MYTEVAISNLAKLQPTAENSFSSSQYPKFATEQYFRYPKIHLKSVHEEYTTNKLVY